MRKVKYGYRITESFGYNYFLYMGDTLYSVS